VAELSDLSNEIQTVGKKGLNWAPFSNAEIPGAGSRTHAAWLLDVESAGGGGKLGFPPSPTDRTSHFDNVLHSSVMITGISPPGRLRGTRIDTEFRS
jgi:hypothetical protein